MNFGHLSPKVRECAERLGTLRAAARSGSFTNFPALYDAIAELLSALGESPWMPIGDEHKDGKPWTFWVPSEQLALNGAWNHGLDCWVLNTTGDVVDATGACSFEIYEPSHAMPIPAPPTVSDGGPTVKHEWKDDIGNAWHADQPGIHRDEGWHSSWHPSDITSVTEMSAAKEILRLASSLEAAEKALSQAVGRGKFRLAKDDDGALSVLAHESGFDYADDCPELIAYLKDREAKGA